jgi:hypothetical protein
MSNSLPVLSQVKSLIFLASKNKEKAIEIQREFFAKCILVSQLISLTQWAAGNPIGALVTQSAFLESNNLIIQSCLMLGSIFGVATAYSMLKAFGFTSSGISKSSLASYWMSFYKGNIPTDSLFAFLQRSAQKGFPWLVSAFIAIGFGISMASIAALVIKFQEPVHAMIVDERPADQERVGLLQDPEEEVILIPGSPRSVD